MVYRVAANLRLFGFDVHVDHVIPINGGMVSGLHVESNLKIIPAKMNLSKGNRILQ